MGVVDDRRGRGVRTDDALAAVRGHPTLARLATSLIERPGIDDVPRPGERLPRRAAVALILRLGDAGTLELLFVKRAEYPGDPWSGHIAFPGGRQEPEDETLWATAVRETWEEIGLDLGRDGEPLGRLDELYPRIATLPSIVVRPYVVIATPSAPLALSDEVAAVFWVPVDRLARRDAHATSVVRTSRGIELREPSFVHEAHIIWGMTYRILAGLLERL